MNSKVKYIVGIDEAGRGPLAGPVAVGAVLVPTDFDFSILSRVADSKKMSEEARERTYREARTLARRKELFYAVVLISPKVIDTIGITSAVQRGVNRALNKLVSNCTLKRPDTRRQGMKIRGVYRNTMSDLNDAGNEVDGCFKYDWADVRLDGLLKAPPEYIYQRTIVKGDVTEPAISLASIMAKVTRDRHMVRLAGKCPGYSFEVHKGYGTKLHRDAISVEGLSPFHRRSFCKKWLEI